MARKRLTEAPLPENELSDKRQAFIDAYMVNGHNATQAAIAAGYSKETARQQGSRLLTNVDVRAEINRLLDQHSMPSEEVIARLTEHARGDLGDVIDDDGAFNWKEARAKGKTGLIKKVKRKTRREHKKDGEIVETIDEEIEFHNPQVALQLLGKYRGLFVEKLEHSVTVALTWAEMVRQSRGDDDSGHS